MKNTEIKIFPASVDDVLGIQEVFYKTWLQTYPNEEFGITIEDIEHKFKDYLTPESIKERSKRISTPPAGEFVFVAKEKERVIGVCRIMVSDTENRITAIYILENFRGQGIGTAFWQEIQKMFNLKKDIVVDVATYNKKAIKFYEKLGFKDTGKRFTEERFKMKSGSIIPEMQMKIKIGTN